MILAFLFFYSIGFFFLVDYGHLTHKYNTLYAFNDCESCVIITLQFPFDSLIIFFPYKAAVTVLQSVAIPRIPTNDVQQSRCFHCIECMISERISLET